MNAMMGPSVVRSRRSAKVQWVATTLLAILLASRAIIAWSLESPDQHAARIESLLTDEERIQLLHGIMPIAAFFPNKPPPPPGVPITAGYVRGVERLGIPDLLETDASLGVANPLQLRVGDTATALPAGLALAATFDTALVEQCGVAIGAEARHKGFNVLLGGGVNLTRDPHNGRNFEYLGEDPWLAGSMAGAAVSGIQSQQVISTVKHFAVNDQETLRTSLDAHLDERALRESDLLAFQFAIERGHPGAVMCAYNFLNQEPACGSDTLLNQVLKKDWKYPGFVMSDWGAVADVSYLSDGLDQESGAQLDSQVWLDRPLAEALSAGRIAQSRVHDSVRRILRSMYATRLDQATPVPTIDAAAHGALAGQAAAEGIVLLKNEGALPLNPELKSILVVGGHADIGVLSGGGSSQVTPNGPASTILPVGGGGIMGLLARQLYMPSSPVRALRRQLTHTRVDFSSGYDIAGSAALATHVDAVIVFATQWQMEGVDAGSLDLPEGQDQLISALAAANPNIVVVLETGNPVRMPWLAGVRAVVEAWYPGQEGGHAIADVLTGAVNPSGRLPITFPVDASQLPRATVPGLGEPELTRLTLDYTEGADVGYRWFARTGQTPLFPFGHGLSYSHFEFDDLRVRPLAHHPLTVSATWRVRNTSTRGGVTTPQLYLVSQAGTPTRRLVAFQRVDVVVGGERRVETSIDPRLLARWDVASHAWLIPPGRYRFALGDSAEQLGASVEIDLKTARFDDQGRPVTVH